MSDNYTQLVDHFDNRLRGEESPEMEQRISNDPETAQEWLSVKLAVDAVQHTALYEEVLAVKEAWQAQQTVVYSQNLSRPNQREVLSALSTGM